MTDYTKVLIERAHTHFSRPGMIGDTRIIFAELLVTLEAATARAENAEAEIVRLTSDRQYITGWNDGFTHVHGELRFPTMLRKMWSGGEVQRWLDAQRIEAARVARSDNGAALVDANARIDALEHKLAGAREALRPFAEEAGSWLDSVDGGYRPLCVEPGCVDADGGGYAHPGSETVYTLDDLRRARAALARLDDKDGG